jgi:hypothetical protein
MYRCKQSDIVNKILHRARALLAIRLTTLRNMHIDHTARTQGVWFPISDSCTVDIIIH